MLTQQILINGTPHAAVITVVKGRSELRHDFIVIDATEEELTQCIELDRNLRTEQCLRYLLTGHWLEQHGGSIDGFEEFFESYSPTDAEVDAARLMVDQGIFRGNGLRCQDPETGEDLAYLKTRLSEQQGVLRFRKLLPRIIRSEMYNSAMAAEPAF